MIDLSKFSIVLLSAGIGKRFGPTGEKKPKCLLQINNKTLIELLIDNLKKRNAKKVSIIVGFKSKMLIKFLKNIKGIKINFIKINGYKKNGHSYSWFLYRSHWLKEKKPMMLFHTDIYFDPTYIDNILRSKKPNIIGVKSFRNHHFKKNSLVVKTNKENKIKSINFYNKIKRPQGEVIGINKFTKTTTENIFNFMRDFFNKKNKSLSWEALINIYIQKTKDSLFILKNQNYYWKNINTVDDYLTAKSIK